MSVKTSKSTPDKQHKHDDAFSSLGPAPSRRTQAVAQHSSVSPQVLYRWQQAQLVAEVGSVEVARDPEVRQLRAQLKWAKQKLNILKKPWSVACYRRELSQPTR